MSNKATIAAIALLALAAFAMVPVADLSADDSEELALTSADGSVSDVTDQETGSNSLFYDCLLVLIIVVIFAGVLHIKAHPRK
jgi:hypothetical protein